jgi:hypothetical protein
MGLPPLLCSSSPTATFTSFPTPGCWACATAPAFSGRLVYLQFHEEFPLPPSSVLRMSRPLCYVSFLLLLLIIQFFFLFSLCGGQSVHGALLMWPSVVCGSTACRLAHLVVCFFPSGLGTGGGMGALLVSPFNVEWECYLWSVGVEESKFCLFRCFFL